MNVHFRRDIARHVRFLSLDRSTIDAARAAWTVIDPHAMRHIDEFCEHLLGSDLGAWIGGTDLPAFKAAQRAHWAALFEGTFDVIYETHPYFFEKKHRSTDVQLLEYISLYSWFSTRFFHVIEEAEPPEPYRRADLIMAANKIIYLDMMIAASASNVFFIDAD